MSSIYGNSTVYQSDGHSESYRPFTGINKDLCFWEINSSIVSVYYFLSPIHTLSLSLFAITLNYRSVAPKAYCPPTQNYMPSGDSCGEENCFVLKLTEFCDSGAPHMRESVNRDPMRRERPRSLYSTFPHSSQISFSDDYKRASNLSYFPPNGTPSIATYATSFAQHSTVQTKVPPLTAPKPQINAQSWTTGSAYSSSPMIPGPGQSSIPGSRPAPRRGRGLLKTAITGSSIPICGSCGTPIR